ncbi:sensor domain-containing diguanylate cyclase [Cytobacillus spongiae]|jgi:diguanylate cyclase (GGDEF)-like protein|uniref:sensor domain-containing diguanylate cyclase n=1 Tax=Cytobacillus spongiae TaxID=2901381 RepID=UPI001F40B6AC|nr:sensor domain-containing diguanylate cyclase [Cytobacillus spongiae]UII55059.1 sensor domain-containing diguanylate cyclase [Cytobacillus spongiae]
MVQPHIKKLIWICWFLIVPAGMWIVYQQFPPQYAGSFVDLTAFFVLVSFVAAMPLVINNTPIFLIQWVSLAVFLSFGLLAEMILVQLAIVVLLLRIRIRKSQLFRFPLNSLMFFIVSLISGLAYYSLGGKHGVAIIENPSAILLALTYAILYYAINQIILSIFFYFVYEQKTNFFEKDFIWETFLSILTFPIGLVLYILYKEVGLISLLFVGVPFASLSIILNLYHSSEKVNDYLQKATEIGHQLAERLQVKDVMDLFIQKLSGMLPVDYAYILDVVDQKELHLILRMEHGKELETDLKPLKKHEGISGLVWATKKTALFNKKKEWRNIVKGYMPPSVESVLSVPIVRNNEVVGVLVLASEQKRAYEKSQLMIVDILCSHLAIALDNARHYEETKENSEKCPLTKLYNYRFFDLLLGNEFAKLEQKKRSVLSLIILDIDHFKSVNDTFGHQSGNEVLCELAARLIKLVGQKGTVARYGGEEFVILLPDIDKSEALATAELVRQTIANRPFTLKQQIEQNESKQFVRITASIGVATAPKDADDSMALVRHADRALYVGAKRAGRNRVAEYIK